MGKKRETPVNIPYWEPLQIWFDLTDQKSYSREQFGMQGAGAETKFLSTNRSEAVCGNGCCGLK